MTDTRLMWITEVHNFGGFFGGDTVTLSAVPYPEGDEATLTIDEKALLNVRDRHTIAPEMLLELDFAGERIDRARLVGARAREVLDQAMGTLPPTDHLSAPRIRAYRCATCDLWITGSPQGSQDDPTCAMCGQSLS